MYIYCIINNINGKQYVGLTTRNVNESMSYYGSGIHITRAIKKYGKANFNKVILEEITDKDKLSTRERYWINELNTISPNGYNLTDGGERGYTISDESLEIMSKKARKFMLSDKNTRRGSTYPTEWRQNISNALTGRTLSKEHRDNLKKAKVGTTTHPNSIKALKKCGKTRKGKSLSTEMIQKLQKVQPTNVVVLQMDKNTGEILNEYFSIHEAQRQTKIWATSICMCCGGKIKTSGGFKWEYKIKRK
jgi:group I intron endonuclease